MSQANLGVRIVLEDAARSGFDALGSSVGSFGARLLGVTGLAAMLGSTLGDTGVAVGTFLAVSAGATEALGFFGEALNSAITAGGDLQTSLVDVQLSVRGASDALPELTTLIIDLADHSLYTSQQIDQAFFALGKHLITAQQILEGVGQAAVDLGLAIGSDAAPAADLLGQAMQVFGIDASEAARVADKLTGAFYNGVPSVEGLSQAFRNAGGTAHAMNIPLDDFLTITDMITPMVGSASQATSSLNFYLRQLEAPSTGAAKWMKNLGLATFDTAGIMVSSKFTDAKGNFLGIANSIDQIYQAIKNLNPAQQMDVLSKMFTIRSSKSLMDLLASFSSFDANFAKIKDAIDKPNQAMKDAELRLETLQAKQKEFASTTTDSWARIGITILPPITQFIGHLNDLADNFNKAPSSVHQAVAAFLLIGTALSGVAVVGIGIFALAALGLLPVFGMMAGVFLGIIGLAAGVTGAFLLISTHARQIGQAIAPAMAILKGVFDDVSKQVMPTLIQVFKQVTPSIKELGTTFGNLWTTAQPVVMALVNLIKIVLGVTLMVTISMLVGLFTALGYVFSGVVAIFTGGLQVISGIFQLVFAAVRLAIDVFMAVITGNFSKLPGLIGTYLGQVGQAIGSIWNGIGHMFVGLITATFGAVAGFIGAFVGTIVSFFTHLFDVLVGHSIIPDMVNAIVRWFLNLVNLGILHFNSLVKGIVGVISGLPGQMFSWAGHAIDMFVSGILGGIGKVVGAVGKVAGVVKGVLGFHSPPAEGPLADSHQYMPNMMSMFADGIHGGLPTLAGAANRAASILSSSITMPSRAGFVGSSSGSSGGQSGDIHNHIYFGGQEVADIVMDRVTRQLKVNGMGRVRS